MKDMDMKIGRLRLSLDAHVYHPTHGPKTFPWWRAVVVRFVRCSRLSGRTPASWNIWIYTRKGAVCGNVNWRHAR